MTGPDLERARKTVGRMWGLGRPVTAAEFGRMIRNQHRDPGAIVRRWETGKAPLPGYAVAYMEALLDGYKPPSAPEPSAVRSDPIPAEPIQVKSRRRG